MTEAGSLTPILQKLNLFQTEYCNWDGAWWQSSRETATIRRTCSTEYVLTLLNSILNKCNALYTMPYLCNDGTSKYSIVACECAMSGIQSGAILCQTDTSTIDIISCFVRINKCIEKMEFCDTLQYLFLSMSMSAPLKNPKILIIGKHRWLQNLPCYKNS